MPTYKGKNNGEYTNPFRVHGIISSEYKQLGVEKEVFYLDQISLDAYEKMKRLFQHETHEIEKTILNEMLDELVDKLKARGYQMHEIERFFEQMDEKTFRETVVKPVYDRVYLSLTVPFFERSAHTVRDYQSFNMGALSMMQGRSPSKDKNTYWMWPMRESMIRRSENDAPYVYFTGPPGSGKSNAIDLTCLTALNMNYWVYTTRPLLARNSTDHIFRISRISDLFVDTKEIPSIFKAIKWAEDVGVKAGVLIATDERGMGELSQSREGRLQQEMSQIRRHFFMSIVEGGVRQKPPALEQDVNILIGTHGESMKETDRMGNPKKKFYWEVVFREPIEDEEGEEKKRIYVYDIPKCNLPTMSQNKFDLTPDFTIDLSMKDMLRSIGDPAKITPDILLERTRDYARIKRHLV